MRFKPGQKVVCTVDGNNWLKVVNVHDLSFIERLKLLLKGNKVLGPKYNQVVTVDSGTQNFGAIPLKEYRQEVFGQYQESCFEPLIKDEVLEAELAETLLHKDKYCLN